MLLAHLSEASCLETLSEVFAEISFCLVTLIPPVELAADRAPALASTNMNDNHTNVSLEAISFKEPITDVVDNGGDNGGEDGGMEVDEVMEVDEGGDEEDMSTEEMTDEETAMSLMATR